MYYYYPTSAHPYRYELHKDMHFSAAHYIDSNQAGICQQMHGHTYYCDITIAGDELDETGFLIDFKIIKELVHQRFEEFLDLRANKPVCIQVLVRETPTSYVIYRPKR